MVLRDPDPSGRHPLPLQGLSDSFHNNLHHVGAIRRSAQNRNVARRVMSSVVPPSIQSHDRRDPAANGLELGDPHTSRHLSDRNRTGRQPAGVGTVPHPRTQSDSIVVRRTRSILSPLEALHHNRVPVCGPQRAEHVQLEIPTLGGIPAGGEEHPEGALRLLELGQLTNVNNDGLQRGLWTQVRHVLGQVRCRVVDVVRSADRAHDKVGVLRFVPAHADVRAVQVQRVRLAQPAGMSCHGRAMNIE